MERHQIPMEEDLPHGPSGQQRGECQSCYQENQTVDRRCRQAKAAQPGEEPLPHPGTVPNCSLRYEITVINKIN